MKKKIILLLLIVVCLCGCEKQDTNTLNVLNWSSYIPDEVLIDFEKSSGIKLNYNTYSSNEELLAKVIASSEGTYDLVFPSDYMIEVMIKRNLLEELDTSKLNNYTNINEHYLNQYFDTNNNYSLPFLLTMPVFAYNSKKVNTEINSYNDLLKEDFRDNIVLIDDQRIVIGMALMANGYDMNEIDKEKLDVAKEWLLKLKPNIKAYDSDSPKSFLITEEADVGVMWNAEAAIAIEENPDIKVAYPSEGAAISMDNFAILKGVKHKEEAYKFIDYILRGDVMKKIIESYPYKNLNKKTQSLLLSDYLDKGTYVKNIGSAIRNYDEIWTTIK